MDTVKQIFSVLLGLVLFIIIMFSAYFALKTVSKKGFFKNSGLKNMKVIERMMLSQDTSVAIVEAAGKMLLIGITSHHIELLCELSPEDIVISEENQNISEFAGILKNLSEKGANGFDRFRKTPKK